MLHSSSNAGAPATTRHRITINDVAKAAGVSKATVSRFVNGGSAQLSPDTAARVAEVIQQLGYKPSPMAQSLKHGRTRLIDWRWPTLPTPSL